MHGYMFYEWNRFVSIGCAWILCSVSVCGCCGCCDAALFRQIRSDLGCCVSRPRSLYSSVTAMDPSLWRMRTEDLGGDEWDDGVAFQSKVREFLELHQMDLQSRDRRARDMDVDDAEEEEDEFNTYERSPDLPLRSPSRDQCDRKPSIDEDIPLSVCSCIAMFIDSIHSSRILFVSLFLSLFLYSCISIA